jgi:hypothetical protein
VPIRTYHWRLWTIFFHSSARFSTPRSADTDVNHFTRICSPFKKCSVFHEMISFLSLPHIGLPHQARKSWRTWSRSRWQPLHFSRIVRESRRHLAHLVLWLVFKVFKSGICFEFTITSIHSLNANESGVFFPECWPIAPYHLGIHPIFPVFKSGIYFEFMITSIHSLNANESEVFLRECWLIAPYHLGMHPISPVFKSAVCFNLTIA